MQMRLETTQQMSRLISMWGEVILRMKREIKGEMRGVKRLKECFMELKFPRIQRQGRQNFVSSDSRIVITILMKF